MQRKQPSQQRSRATTNTILDASAQVLIELGYSRATTNRIANRAGCSVGTLYQYFTNKDEIFVALIQREADSYLCELEKCLPASGMPRERAIRGFMEAGYANPSLIHTLRVVMRHLPKEGSAVHSQYLRNGLHKLTMKLLERLGPFQEEPDLSLTADIIIGLSEGLTYLGRVQRTPKELADIMTNFVIQYLQVSTTVSMEETFPSSAANHSDIPEHSGQA
jgi:AcrR family transcriptional regulator